MILTCLLLTAGGVVVYVGGMWFAAYLKRLR